MALSVLHEQLRVEKLRVTPTHTHSLSLLCRHTLRGVGSDEPWPSFARKPQRLAGAAPGAKGRAGVAADRGTGLKAEAEGTWSQGAERTDMCRGLAKKKKKCRVRNTGIPSQTRAGVRARATKGAQGGSRDSRTALLPGRSARSSVRGVRLIPSIAPEPRHGRAMCPRWTSKFHALRRVACQDSQASQPASRPAVWGSVSRGRSSSSSNSKSKIRTSASGTSLTPRALSRLGQTWNS